MPSPLRNIAVIAAIAVAAITAFVAYSAHQKRTQKAAIVALVDRGTGVLSKSLQGAPGPAEVAAAQLASSELSALDAPKQRAFQRAADLYLSGVRTIVQRRAESQPAIARATASRDALVQHLSAVGRRDAGWARRASELQARAKQDQADLERLQGSIADLLEGMAREEPLAQYVDRSTLVPEPLLAVGARQAREAAMSAAARLDQARLPGAR